MAADTLVESTIGAVRYSAATPGFREIQPTVYGPILGFSRQNVKLNRNMQHRTRQKRQSLSLHGDAGMRLRA